MSKTNKKHILRIALVAILSISAIQSTYARRFWGTEEQSQGIQGTPDGSQCFETVVVTRYIFWIEVSSSVDTREVPCG